MPREEEKAPPVFDHLGPREEERGFGVLGCGDIREEEDVAANNRRCREEDDPVWSFS